MSSDPSEHGGPYVFGTNVLVSALLFAQSRPRQAFDAALAHGQILTSLELLSELDAVLSRPKFNRYLLREERALPTGVYSASCPDRGNRAHRGLPRPERQQGP
jgi:hypothetical protein